MWKMQNKSSIFSLFALLSIVATIIDLYANVIIEKDIAQGLLYAADIKRVRAVMWLINEIK